MVTMLENRLKRPCVEMTALVTGTTSFFSEIFYFSLYIHKKEFYFPVIELLVSWNKITAKKKKNFHLVAEENTDQNFSVQLQRQLGLK